MTIELRKKQKYEKWIFNAVNFAVTGILLTISLFLFGKLIGNADSALGYKNLFDVSEPSKQGNNFIFIYSFIILMLAGLLSSFWNHRNLNTKNTSPRQYLPFYVAYLLVSIVSFILLLAFNVNKVGYENTKWLIYRSFPFLTFLVINSVYSAVNFFEYKKANPNYKSLLIHLIFANTVKFIIFTSLFILLALFATQIKPTRPLPEGSVFNLNENLFTSANSTRNFVKQYLQTQSSLGALIWIVFSILLVSYIYAQLVVVIISNKDYLGLKTFAKSLFQYTVYVASIFVFWMLINTFLINSKYSQLNNESDITINVTYWVINLVLSLLMLVVFTLIIHYYGKKINSQYQRFIFAGVILLLNVLALTFRFSYDDNFSGYVILLTNALGTLWALVVWKIYINKFKFTTNIYYVSVLVSLAFAIFFEVINANLIKEGNFSLKAILFSFKFVDIFLICSITFSSIALGYQIIKWIYSASQIVFIDYKKQKRSVNNEVQ
ncbi:MSC_0624 family F1-like ATPase-associated membrane protein [Mycoplasma nasistruthionis]|uniref:Uncharacterized protein n=1 Tax=Mycoplasma nasistruthionis TaxID=353852 RepID=A0A4Y6I671_9MOLU|nr:hypothetical protein [Mycoplasma nasistruthionis]QDF65023.1 hypothetical protein FIV53_01780 [Mycoplasma nasistruthionis]